ncbi:MAG: cob(I)yrinic acid a,c-diamide adenosyltransferase [Gemmatimonadaceae bacterium]
MNTPTEDTAIPPALASDESPTAGIKPARVHRERKNPYRVKDRAERRGLLMVHTGNGKGKSTAALGVLVRASGYNMSVGMFQFIKSAETLYGEHIAAKELGAEIVPLGDGFTWLSDNIDADRELAERGWTRVREAIESGTFDVLILDELTYCITYKWLAEEEVLSVLRNRASWMHVIVTGRNASPTLIELADLVTEMHLVKHPYREQGIGAQPGIEL